MSSIPPRNTSEKSLSSEPSSHQNQRRERDHPPPHILIIEWKTHSLRESLTFKPHKKHSLLLISLTPHTKSSLYSSSLVTPSNPPTQHFPLYFYPLAVQWLFTTAEIHSEHPKSITTIIPPHHLLNLLLSYPNISSFPTLSSLKLHP